MSVLVKLELQDKFVAFVNKLVHAGIGKDLDAHSVRLVKKVLNNRRTICNKSRKVAVSYTMAATCLAVAILLGKNCAIVGPGRRASETVMDYLRQLLEKAKEFVDIESEAESASKIRIIGGGTIWALPNNPATVRSLDVNGLLVIDEFAHFADGDDLKMFAAAGPFISLGGHIAGVSTPNGERGLFHEIWTREDKHEGWARELINWRECGRFKEEDLRMGVVSQEQWEQEFENKFIGDVENEIEWKDIMACVDRDLEYVDLPPSTNNNMYGGVDIGRNRDFTALAVVEDSQGSLAVVHKTILKKTPYPDQERLLDPWISKCSMTAIDQGGIGDQLSEGFKTKYGGRVEEASFSAELKESMVTTVKRVIIEKRIRIPDDAQLHHSIHAVKRTRTASGASIKYEIKRTAEIGHGDLFWALALAVRTAERGRAVQLGPSAFSGTNYSRRRSSED